MEKYRRLKTIAGDGTITRYYDLKAGEDALCNCFYGIKTGKAEKISEAVGEGIELIGFSHGGNNVAKGKILLDINPAVEYMCILGNDTARPAIGEVVNGYQKVTAVHYDGDVGYVTGEFGVETLDAPYYIFTIVQPKGSTSAAGIDDTDAGETSGEVK